MFSIKGPQLVTHIKRLKDVEIPLANFFSSGVFALGQRLGPFVWQLPGNMKYDPARIELWSRGGAMTDGHFVTPVVRDNKRREVFLFFDNTDKLKAPGDATNLMRRLAIEREADVGGNDKDRDRRLGL